MYNTIFIMSGVVLLLDQIIKKIIELSMNVNSSISIIDGFFNITYVQNTGAAFSMFQNSRLFLVIIALLSLLLIIYMVTHDKNKTNLNKLSYGLLIGGIIGNLVDRVFLGYVIDYLDFNIFGYSFPVFNLADIGIVVGIFLMVIIMMWGERYGKARSK